MEFKELREMCMNAESELHKEGMAVSKSQTLWYVPFDGIVEMVMNRESSDYWLVYIELIERIDNALAFIDFDYDTNDYFYFRAEMLKALDSELGTSYYKDVYGGNIERWLKEQKEIEEMERIDEENAETRETVCKWAANDMDMSLDEAYDMYDVVVPYV
jgi:hypothetical protein